MTTTQIIGFAGKKQSGKNCACNFILATKLAELGICRASRLSPKGGIEVTDIFDLSSTDGDEWFPFEPPHVATESLFENELGRYVKLYSFAEKLKRLAIDLLGLKEEWVFGTDAQKNTKTHLKWESFSDSKTGEMTAREVLQHVGTDIFRSLNENVWIDSCFRQIEEENPELALISDVRFKNEIKGIQDRGGFVIGLTRGSAKRKKKDNHASETEIGESLDLCDIIIDNTDLTIPEQNEAIYNAIKELNFIPDIT